MAWDVNLIETVSLEFGYLSLILVLILAPCSSISSRLEANSSYVVVTYIFFRLGGWPLGLSYRQKFLAPGFPGTFPYGSSCFFSSLKSPKFWVLGSMLELEKCIRISDV